MNLASLALIQSTISSFTSSIEDFFEKLGSISDYFASIRVIYEISNIPNRVKDGTEPYPENNRTLSSGIAIEFR